MTPFKDIMIPTVRVLDPSPPGIPVGEAAKMGTSSPALSSCKKIGRRWSWHIEWYVKTLRAITVITVWWVQVFGFSEEFEGDLDQPSTCINRYFSSVIATSLEVP